MTTGAAVIAIVAALMGGYYFARWRRSEGSLKSAKTLAEGAGKAAWGARRAMLLTGLVIATVIYLWIHGKGRLGGSWSVLPVGGPGGREARWRTRGLRFAGPSTEVVAVAGQASVRAVAIGLRPTGGDCGMEVTGTIIYRGTPPWHTALVQFLKEEGVRVEWSPSAQEEPRGLGADVNQVVVSTGTPRDRGCGAEVP